MDKITVVEAKEYIEQEQFTIVCMLPKIQTIIGFLEVGGKEAVVTNTESIGGSLRDEAGTYVIL